MVLAQQQKHAIPALDANQGVEYLPKGAQRISLIAQKMLNTQDNMEEVFSEYSESMDKEQDYVYSQVRPGGGSPLELDSIDPYALCFALIYLADTGSDLPWLYGRA